VFVADLWNAIRPQPVDLAADPLQPPGYERLAALRQGSVDLLEQVVWAVTDWHIAQNDLSILGLDRRQTTRLVDHAGHSCLSFTWWTRNALINLPLKTK
jgi:hypothetical protein